MKMSNTVGAIAKALAAAQKVMEGAKRDSLNPHFKSKYADLESTVAAIKAPLADNGIAYVQTLCTDEKGALGCETLLMHESGEWVMSDPYYIPLTKQDAHGAGSCATYARRYSLAAACGVAPEDDDGNAAAKAAPKELPVDPVEREIALQTCWDAALQGRTALVSAWKKLSDQMKASLSPEMGSLGKAADAADQNQKAA